MAKVTNAFDTYSATSDREQLSNVIYNISPQTTPFLSAIGKNSIKNVVFDWQTENLPTPSGAGQLEGFELARSAATATARVSNVAQISKRDATVSGSQQASDPAGKKSEMAHQLAIMSKALKRDMETALCQKGAKTTGNATTARVTGGFESWITSNVSRGTGGGGAQLGGESARYVARYSTRVRRGGASRPYERLQFQCKYVCTRVLQICCSRWACI